jgi:hypothetical protein
MKIRQTTLKALPQPGDLDELASIQPQLVFAFGSVAPFTAEGFHGALKAAFPQATLVGCTTAGEIADSGVSDGEVVLSAVFFEQPDFKLATTTLGGMDDSGAAGTRLASQLVEQAGAGLHNVLVLGQGVDINGSALIEGFERVLPKSVALSGGLAGDGAAFKETFTLSNAAVSNRQLVALGFHGPRTQVRHGSFHGWQPFGPARKVTRSAGNVLFELDGEPALEVYKRYLGEYAKDLPGSGLLFPFEMLGEDLNAVGLIRTILAVDEAAGSLVLAGDIVENGYLKLMHASTDSLVEGAQTAAERTFDPATCSGESLALLVSCVGRKLVMGARVDEEVEAVAEVFGRNAHVTGFYSNGEISPLLKGMDCRLHNQTMTITHLSEAAA